ncbi:unnamed protein product [Malus baccata var. baccata]
MSSKAFIFFLVVAMVAGTALTFTLKMKPIPFPQNHTLVQEKKVEVSKSRAAAMSSSLRQSTTEITAPVKRSFSGFFYVELWIGTPPVKANLAIDTGSDLTWVQCADCTKCFPVALPNFDGKKSATYRAMSPRHPLCPDPPPLGRNDSCSYEVSYYGEHIEKGQSSSGRFGWDVFTFKSEIRGQQKQQQLVTNVAFGCGIVNHIDTGHQGPEGNPIAGLLGLAYTAPSNFLKQLRNITLERFSYCLPMDVESANGTLIHFGKAAQISGPNTTPILGQGGYYVQLKGIRLNGRLVPIDPKLFMEPVSETVIDSGTQHSFITAKAYVVLKRAVISHFQDAYGWNPLNNTRKHADYDLCYEIHRGGRQSTFREYIQENQFCMTILPLDEHLQLNVLGAYQQANHRFLFDVADLKLSFIAKKKFK